MDRTIKITNVDNILFERLKFEADKQGIDLKTLVLTMIKKSLGLEKITDKGGLYHDLDYLSGTWSDQEAKNFAENNKRILRDSPIYYLSDV